MKKSLRTLLYVFCSVYLAYSILQSIDLVLFLSSYKNANWSSVYLAFAMTVASAIALVLIIIMLLDKTLRNGSATIGAITILYGFALTRASSFYLGGLDLSYYYDDAIKFSSSMLTFMDAAMLILGTALVAGGCTATAIKNNRIKKQGLQPIAELQERAMPGREALLLAIGAMTPLLLIISVFSYQLSDRFTTKKDQPVSINKDGMTLSFTQPANTKIFELDAADMIFINIDSSATDGCRINIKTNKAYSNTQGLKYGEAENIAGQTFYHSQYTATVMKMNDLKQAQTYTMLGQKNYLQIQYYSGNCSDRGGDMSEQLNAILRTLQFKD